jgi:hypothetical protein
MLKPDCGDCFMRFLVLRSFLLVVTGMFILIGFDQGMCAEPTPEEQLLMTKIDNENKLAIAIFYDHNSKHRSETVLYSMLTACGHDEYTENFDIPVDEIYKFAFAHGQLRPFLNNKSFSYEVAARTAMMFVFYRNGQINSYELLAQRDSEFCPGVLETAKNYRAKQK